MTDNFDHYKRHRELSGRLAVLQADLHRVLDSIASAEAEAVRAKDKAERIRYVMRDVVRDMNKHAEFML